MSVVTTIKPRTRRGTELLLLLFAIGIVVLAYVNVGVAVRGSVPPDLWPTVGGLVVLALALHAILRWKASYADPLILPIATLLNGLGLVMLNRIDLANGVDYGQGFASRQLLYSTIGVVLAGLVLVLLRDHRVLRRYTYIAMAVGLGLLLLPLLPVIGHAEFGSRIWIRVAGFSFQPAEIAKIALAVFFAGYLVQTRDALSLVGRRFLGLALPRARDLGPILLVWGVSLAIMIFERDLGTSLLVFGLFVAMLYVATERLSWVLIGIIMFMGGAYVAYRLFGHVQQRVEMWLDPFSDASLAISDQLPRGLMGMAHGGLVGTGLGEGYPTITYRVESDFILTAFGEEMGLIGVFAILVLYLLLVERGLRTAIGAREGFGKLLAAGLAFSVALQVFVVVGGLTRVIPLTGLTTPFLAQGGSSLLANWMIVALLLRISDHARRPVEERAAPVATPQAPADSPSQGRITPHQGGAA